MFSGTLLQIIEKKKGREKEKEKKTLIFSDFRHNENAWFVFFSKWRLPPLTYVLEMLQFR